jgi:hypothetical protein
MFAKAYQSGSAPVEVLSASGKDPSPKLLKINQVTKIYERSIKGYIYNLERVSTQTILQCPASSKDSLGIFQQYLVLQLFPFAAKHIHLEVVVTDARSQRRRLLFSTSYQRIESNELHCQIPWVIENRDVWNSVIIDMKGLTSRCFNGANFATLESFSLRPCCLLRKIFTVPNVDFGSSLLFPHSVCFPIGVDSKVCILDDGVRNAPPAQASTPQPPSSLVVRPASEGLSIVGNELRKPDSKQRRPASSATTPPSVASVAKAGGDQVLNVPSVADPILVKSSEQNQMPPAVSRALEERQRAAPLKEEDKMLAVEVTIPAAPRGSDFSDDINSDEEDPNDAKESENTFRNSYHLISSGAHLASPACAAVESSLPAPSLESERSFAEVDTVARNSRSNFGMAVAELDNIAAGDVDRSTEDIGEPNFRKNENDIKLGGLDGSDEVMGRNASERNADGEVMVSDGDPDVVVLDGDNKDNYLSAVVVPDPKSEYPAMESYLKSTLDESMLFPRPPLDNAKESLIKHRYDAPGAGNQLSVRSTDSILGSGENVNTEQLRALKKKRDRLSVLLQAAVNEYEVEFNEVVPSF